MEPKQIILNSPMGRLQKQAIAVCFALQAIDGFDVLAVTFAAPGIAHDWHASPIEVGSVISASPIGMLLGSLLLSPVADIIGRRLLVLSGIVLMAASMFLAAVAPDVGILAIWRLITGLGVGAILGTLTALSGEYANKGSRDLAIGIMAVGYPVGGFAGGCVAALLLQHHSWHSIFVFGGLVTAGMLPIAYFFLPESIEFLAQRRGIEALPKINAILKRMGHSQIANLGPARARGSTSWRHIFSRELVRSTLLLTLACALHNLTFYDVIGWTPSNVVALGFSQAQAASVSVAINFGGIVGAIAFGFASSHFDLRFLLLALFGLTSFGLVLLAAAPANLGVLTIIGFCVGLFMFASVVGIFATCTRLFDADVRATGAGFVIGLGRIGAILGPTIGGFLISMGLARSYIITTMAVGSLLALICLVWLQISSFGELDQQKDSTSTNEYSLS